MLENRLRVLRRAPRFFQTRTRALRLVLETSQFARGVFSFRFCFVKRIQGFRRARVRGIERLARFGESRVGVAQPSDFLRHRLLGDGDGAPGFEHSLFPALDVRLARLELLDDAGELRALVGQRALRRDDGVVAAPLLATPRAPRSLQPRRRLREFPRRRARAAADARACLALSRCSETAQRCSSVSRRTAAARASAAAAAAASAARARRRDGARRVRRLAVRDEVRRRRRGERQRTRVAPVRYRRLGTGRELPIRRRGFRVGV